MLKRSVYLSKLIDISLSLVFSPLFSICMIGVDFASDDYDQYQFFEHPSRNLQLQLIRHLMKKSPITPTSPWSPGGAFYSMSVFLLRGLIAGVLFQGTFLLFNFERRIVRSVASKRLEEVKMLEEDTAERVKKGQKPLVETDFLRDQVVIKLNKNKQNVV